MSEGLVGTQVGRYRLEKILGEGGMGCVYLGVDDERASRVAIKVLSMQTPESMQRFRAEARAVSLISHFNIVNLVDVAELPDGRPYMVMELVEGRSLRDVAPGASVETIVRICGEVLAALEAAHAIGIVHRDLKPDNIMVTRTGHAKVLDFGVAKLAPGVGGGNTPRTAEGLTMGTPAYMAPEQVIGGAVDARTDVYTMGVVLFEVLTGQRPFSGGSDVEVMRAHRDRPPARPRTLAPAIPAAVELVILRALAKDPMKRFQTARAMAAALADAIEGRGPKKLVSSDETPTPRERPAAPARRSRAPAMIAVVAIAIAATVAFMIARLRRNEPPAPSVDTAIVADAVPPPADANIANVPVVVDAATADDAALEPTRDPAIDAAIAADPDAKPDTRAPTKATLPSAITQAPDFSTDAFDPLGYLGRATELAKQVASDAQLVELQATPIAPTNVVDLSRQRRRVEYRYFSASGAKAPPIDGRHPCVVVVSVSPAGAQARLETNKRCAMKPVPPPRCTLNRIREAVSTFTAETTDISVTFRGRWTVVAYIPEDDPLRMEVPDC
ncbi:MAG: serine/threonine-protein kinase [Kofleriaceae bacterium]